MSIPSRTAARCCRQIVRHSSSSSSSPFLRISRTSSSTFVCQQQQRRRTSPGARRWQSTDAAAAAVESTNPKIIQIVDQISQLTLLETADLVSSLKSRLNIPDLPVGGFAMAAGPAAGAAPAAEEEEAAPAAAEKTLFNLKLESFEATSKPKVIKEIKSMLGLSLVDSKKFVESVPKVMKENVAKDECEKIIETLKGLGAKVVME